MANDASTGCPPRLTSRTRHVRSAGTNLALKLDSGYLARSGPMAGSEAAMAIAWAGVNFGLGAAEDDAKAGAARTTHAASSTAPPTRSRSHHWGVEPIDDRS